MRKRNATGNQGNNRNVKVARIGGDDNNNKTGSQMDASDIMMQPGSHNTSASSRFGPRSLNNANTSDGCTQKGLQSGTRCNIGQQEWGTHTGTYDPPTNIDYQGRYRLEIDSRADTMCCGKGFVPVRDMDSICDVHGFHPSMAAIENVSIRTCATAFDHEQGKTLILVFGQALWFGDDLVQSLACPGQIRAFNHLLCLNPKQYTDGKSLHGIHVEDDDVTLHFRMHGCISYLPIRTPTKEELDECRWIYLTSEEHWNPYDEHFANAEEAMMKKTTRTKYSYEHVSYDSGGRAVFATSSKEHRSNISPEMLSWRWGTSVDIARCTLRVTTQRGIRNLESPLSRQFRTRQTHLRYNHLRTDVDSDTLFSETKSARGYTCGQLFVTSHDFAEFHPMRTKGDAPYKLDLFCKTYGLPQVLITDNEQSGLTISVETEDNRTTFRMAEPS